MQWKEGKERRVGQGFEWISMHLECGQHAYDDCFCQPNEHSTATGLQAHSSRQAHQHYPKQKSHTLVVIAVMVPSQVQ